ncbi:MAG TPA: NAD(P)/FAD-dependent oxidoreductase [Acetivibrio sp.]|uniref:NAD(P)/FAD-dependent oxidoreductase n=1 Tax=Acetivibrio sp. TaxID=1872092 RepID=UPI002CDF1843|nr:NAD(P)/FAD-dependent oxidoreductase [Acetivibrio sp.]HOM02833.1 NAD(P)/FAD-dependent oxidoreductase [Acetivibrio sp.]
MYDVIIIGKGPAGISASLYTVRANLKTLVIGKGDSALAKAEKIENYYGFSEVISGRQLLGEGEKQALRLGVEIVESEVISIEQNEFFEVLTSSDRYMAKAVLIATGQPQKKLRIENLEAFEGKGVSYCTTCDGFFYNNLKVGVVGAGDYVVHEAMELLSFTKDITIYTDGKELQVSEKFEEAAKRFKINTKAIYKIDGSEFLQKIFFKDGTSEDIDGLFIAYESPSSVDFARKLGIIVEGNAVVVDKNQQTNLKGVFAAGDCTGGFKQIATAVGQGALAGKRIAEYVKSL